MTQSRWADEFARHPFQAVWEGIKQDLENAEVDDQTVTTSVTELARLKRVVIYLDEIISTVDPDLTPRSVWNNFQSQADPCWQQIKAYASDKNISHIQQANEHADNLLTYVRPYMVLPQEALGALQKSAQTYASELESHITSFRERSGSLLNEIRRDREGASTRLRGLQKAGDKIDALAKELFDGSDGVVPTKTQIDSLVADIVAKMKQVNDLHATLLVDLPDKSSVQTQTKNAATEILVRRKDMEKVLEGAQEQIDELDRFHEKIFGKPGKEKGETTGGLEFELDSRMTQLQSYETDQKAVHKALFEKVESLLPGATSAGLASAYRSLKESFDNPIANYTKYFYLSLGLIALGAVVFSIENISVWPPAITFAKIKDWDEILRGLVGKAGFVIPVVWLALFSATRRSQYERLQQEYAHKEAFASSYESYKKQLQDLNGNSDDLQRELISKAVEAISHNASITLDGKHHEEKPPLVQLLEKANFEPLQKLLDSLKGIKATVEK
ncbi:hypothetical protein [Cupriavidus plantarum]|uniref:hypothetical protein n=1 Tax=Cupriavidus plantarum TaxID=942865 RepID=UPI00339D9B55